MRYETTTDATRQKFWSVQPHTRRNTRKSGGRQGENGIVKTWIRYERTGKGIMIKFALPLAPT